MADAPDVHIGENSPEYVAYRLLDLVRRNDPQYGGAKPKKELLDLYAECLNAVHHPYDRVPRK